MNTHERTHTHTHTDAQHNRESYPILTSLINCSDEKLFFETFVFYFW